MTTEETAHKAMCVTLEEWGARWVALDPKSVPGGASATILARIDEFRGRIVRFVRDEGPFLPSRVLFRRMVAMDDCLIRIIYESLPADECATLDAEAAASVEAYGSVIEAHRARLLRDRFGIPRPF